jgi:hypothetical protein
MLSVIDLSAPVSATIIGAFWIVCLGVAYKFMGRE